MKIMFVCTGNICRSAMAHWLMEKKLKDNNIKNVEIYSCGIFASDGDMATYNACDVMEEYEVDLTKHRATNIKKSNIEEMDLILCATTSHKNTILYEYPNLKNKVFTMKEYVQANEEKEDLDIKDPWGYDVETYRFCAIEIDACLEKLVKLIL